MEREKRVKTKIGEILIKSPAYIGTVEKPIWAWVDKTYWTGDKNKCVININFKKDELLIANMLYKKLVNKYMSDKGIDIGFSDVRMSLKGHNNGDYQKVYFKLFINIDPSIVSIDKIVDDINEVAMRSVTTFKPHVYNDKLEKFKYKAVAQLL